jgi:hypothetical protein
LEDEEEAAVASFAAEGTPENDALVAWAAARGIRVSSRSEAALLRLLVRAGAESLQERILDLGYSELAVTLQGEEHADSHEARRRYVSRREAAAAE